MTLRSGQLKNNVYAYKYDDKAVFCLLASLKPCSIDSWWEHENVSAALETHTHLVTCLVFSVEQSSKNAEIKHVRAVLRANQVSDSHGSVMGSPF